MQAKFLLWLLATIEMDNLPLSYLLQKCDWNTKVDLQGQSSINSNQIFL